MLTSWVWWRFPALILQSHSISSVRGNIQCLPIPLPGKAAFFHAACWVSYGEGLCWLENVSARNLPIKFTEPPNSIGSVGVQLVLTVNSSSKLLVFFFFLICFSLYLKNTVSSVELVIFALYESHLMPFVGQTHLDAVCRGLMARFWSGRWVVSKEAIRSACLLLECT